MKGLRQTFAGQVSVSFLENFLVPRLWPGAVVVMDNPSAHKAKAGREKIEAVRARLLHLSPYSLDFNPIEMTWSKLKARLCKVAGRLELQRLDIERQKGGVARASREQAWVGAERWERRSILIE